MLEGFTIHAGSVQELFLALLSSPLYLSPSNCDFTLGNQVRGFPIKAAVKMQPTGAPLQDSCTAGYTLPATYGEPDAGQHPQREAAVFWGLPRQDAHWGGKLDRWMSPL